MLDRPRAAYTRAAPPPVMATTVTLAVSGDEPPVFPERCAGCGAPPATTSKLVITRLVEASVGRTATGHDCLAGAALRGLRPRDQGGVPRRVRALRAGLPRRRRRRRSCWSAGSRWSGASTTIRRPGRRGRRLRWCWARWAACSPASPAGSSWSWSPAWLLLPVLGRALWRAPLLVPSLLTDADRVAGMTARANAQMTELTVTFDDDDFARAFVAVNGATTRA